MNTPYTTTGGTVGYSIFKASKEMVMRRLF